MRGTNYCTRARARATDDPVGRSYQLFSNGEGGGLRGDTDIEVFLCCLFFYIISERERERKSEAAALL